MIQTEWEGATAPMSTAKQLWISAIQLPTPLGTPTDLANYTLHTDHRPGTHHLNFELITLIALDAVIDAAYAWLCEQRKQYHHNNDVWQVRRWRRWNKVFSICEVDIQDNRYQAAAASI